MNTFQFRQADDGTARRAFLSVPGCGRNEKDDAPIILVQQDHLSGEITLLVFADIQSTEPTHEIPLNGAKLKAKPTAKLEPALGLLMQSIGNARERKGG